MGSIQIQSLTWRAERNSLIVETYKQLGNYRATGRQLGLSLTSASIRKIVLAAKAKAQLAPAPTVDTPVDTPVKSFQLDTRTLHCLTAARITTLEDLCQMDLEKLRRVRGFGAKSLARLREFVSDHKALRR